MRPPFNKTARLCAPVHVPWPHQGCGLAPRGGVPHGDEGLVVWGGHTKMFGGEWNATSVANVRNVTGTCAGHDGCPLCVLLAAKAYPGGFPGRSTNPACNITGPR